jgi:hypothetical protein
MKESGCLASYGTTLREGFAMQAALIDKMLKGRVPKATIGEAAVGRYRNQYEVPWRRIAIDWEDGR